MDENGKKVLDLDRKWPLVVSISNWKGVNRLDVRTYNPEMQPTKKGINLPLEEVTIVVQGILEVYAEATGTEYELVQKG